MEEFVAFDLYIHKEEYLRMNIEHLTWAIDQFRENYQLDVVTKVGQTIPEYVEDHLEELTILQPPEGNSPQVQEHDKMVQGGA